MSTQTIKTTTWAQAKAVYERIVGDPRFAQIDHKDRGRGKNITGKRDMGAYFLTRKEVKQHFDYRGTWPGARRLELLPMTPVVFINIDASDESIRVSIERMVECECGSMLHRNEALGIPPLPPTPKQIEAMTKQFREEGFTRTAEKWKWGGPPSEGTELRCYRFDPKDRAFTTQLPN